MTGGGPAPPPLTAAEAMAQGLEGRPGVHGIDPALDTDGKQCYRQHNL